MSNQELEEVRRLVEQLTDQQKDEFLVHLREIERNDMKDTCFQNHASNGGSLCIS